MKDKIKKEITGLMQNKFDFETSDGKEVTLYLKKTYHNGEVKWNLRDIYESGSINIEDRIGVENGYKQVLIDGFIDEHEDGYKYCDIRDASITEKSTVDKPKEDVKEYLSKLWRICFPDTHPSTLTRQPKVEDFKITTTWGRGKAGHMGKLPVGSDKNFKMGVNWQTWHRRGAENKVRFLTHELTHIIHSHHREEFFIEHARSVINILDSHTNREEIESWFGPIDWDKVKAITLDGPHQQSSEIIVGNSKHRLDAVQKVIEKMEDILNYEYSSAQRFYLNPPITELKLGYVKNTDESEYEIVDVEKLDFESNFTDIELSNHIDSKLTSDESYGFNYGTDKLPVIDDSFDVIENDWFVNVIVNMRREKWKNTPIQMRDDELDINIPCVLEK